MEEFGQQGCYNGNFDVVGTGTSAVVVWGTDAPDVSGHKNWDIWAKSLEW